MNDRAVLSDPRVAAFFREGPTAPSTELLARTFAVTRRTPQRHPFIALAASASAIPPRPGIGFATKRRVAVAVLVVIALMTVVLVAGRSLLDRSLIVPPTAAPTDAATLRPAPSRQRGTIFRIPGGTATFAAVMQSGWRLAGDNQLAGNSVRIVTQTYISQSFDVTEVAWIVVSATTDPIEEVTASLVAAGWSAATTSITIPGLAGVILVSDGGQLDPTALVEFGGVTYRIAAHYTTAAGIGLPLLKSFLANFTPLGSAPEGAVYRDEPWHFAMLYEATPVTFRPGLELGNGVTRFADAVCANVDRRMCDRYVDVIRRPNTSPMGLDVGGVGTISLIFDPGAGDYIRVAAAWDAAIGPSNGTATFDWQGVLVHDAQNQVSCAAAPLSYCTNAEARFIHRGEEWLIMVASLRDDEPYNRLRAFLAGVSLLPPG